VLDGTQFLRMEQGSKVLRDRIWVGSPNEAISPDGALSRIRRRSWHLPDV